MQSIIRVVVMERQSHLTKQVFILGLSSCADESKQKKVFWRRSVFGNNGSWEIGHAWPRGRNCGPLYLSSSGAFCVSHCNESVLISIVSAHGSTFRYHANDFNVSSFPILTEFGCCSLFSLKSRFRWCRSACPPIQERSSNAGAYLYEPL